MFLMNLCQIHKPSQFFSSFPQKEIEPTALYLHFSFIGQDEDPVIVSGWSWNVYHPGGHFVLTLDFNVHVGEDSLTRCGVIAR